MLFPALFMAEILANCKCLTRSTNSARPTRKLNSGKVRVQYTDSGNSGDSIPIPQIQRGVGIRLLSYIAKIWLILGDDAPPPFQPSGTSSDCPDRGRGKNCSTMEDHAQWAVARWLGTGTGCGDNVDRATRNSAEIRDFCVSRKASSGATDRRPVSRRMHAQKPR